MRDEIGVVGMERVRREKLREGGGREGGGKR